MSEYDKVRTGKLVLKGEKQKAKKRKHKSKKAEKEPTVDRDALDHANWWKVNKFEDINGPVAIEFGKHTYVRALDNGLFTLGAPHGDGEGPAPEEILTAVPVSELKMALKSGYNKYLRVEKDGIVTGRSDAIGVMEQWEPIFQDGKMAIQGYNECFMSVNEDDDTVVAFDRKADKKHIVQMRSQTVKNVNPLKDVATEDQGSLSQVEINYVKKFQKFQDKRLRINTGDKKELDQAKTEGNLHETLLDRRSKMKADRYCK